MAPQGEAITNKKYRSTDYCFTAYCDNEPFWHPKDTTYLIYQREAGNETHREHWQGYVEFKNAKSISAAQKTLKIGKAHMEKRQGTPTQAAEYCMKEETRLEGTESKSFGVRKEDPQQGKRNDLKDVADAIILGKRVREITNEFPVPYIKYHKGIEKLRTFQIQPRDEPPTVTVFWGPTGIGKSRRARELVTDPYIWGPEQGKWFDGYDGEDDCIFEEFRGQLPFGFLLRLLDRYDCRVECKGSTTQFRAKNIVLTSPQHPRDWYNLSDDKYDKIDQLLRRITKIEELK